MLKTILFSLLLISYIANMTCQNKVIDSLNIIINSPKTNDTTLIQSYNEISEAYFQINPDTTKQICKENVERIDFLLKNSRKGFTPRERKVLLIEKIRAQNNIAVIILNAGKKSEALAVFLGKLIKC